jgi:Tol biopolymer transport system component
LNAEAARPEPEPSAPADVVPPPASARPAEAVKAARIPEGTVGTAAPATGLTDSETAWSPSFAAAGTAMFYHAQGERGSALMRADTSDEGTTLRITRIVDDNSRNFHARPSPDGAQIAFDSDRDGERGVYIANSDGTNVRRVSGEGFAAVPSWSPDGTTLAFVRAESDKPRVWNLWTLDLKTGEIQRLTSNRYGQMWGASWFPDGRHVAYSHEFRIVVLDTLTGRERSYQTPRKGKLVRTPAVSPDGNRIMFQVYQDGAWLLEVEDGSMRKVLADPSAEEYSWSPDGRRVAYHSRRSGEWGVWLMTSAR